MSLSLPRRALALLPFLGAPALLAPRPARATTQITPILVEFLPGQAAAVVTVTNPGAEAAAFEIDILAWSQTVDADVQEPTEDIIASPPAATIPPGESQVVRLVLRRRGNERERAYRLRITELPAPSRRAARQVGFSVVSSVPVFVVPATGGPGRLAWQLGRAADGTPELVARNTGSRFVRIPTLTATTLGGQPVRLRPRADIPYVLPGVERRWAILGGARATEALRIAGMTQAGPFEQVVPIVP